MENLETVVYIALAMSAVPFAQFVKGFISKAFGWAGDRAADVPLVGLILEGVIDDAGDELVDALLKVSKEVQARGADGQFSNEDKKAILKVLKYETIGEVQRRLAAAKK